MGDVGWSGPYEPESSSRPQARGTVNGRGANRGKTKGRFRPKFSGGSSQLAPNLLDRQFAPEPDRRRGSGISRMSPPAGMAASGRGHQRPDPAGAGLQRFKRLTEELVVKAFANAWALHPQRPGLIFHSDRGGQYWGNEFRQLLQSHGVVQSMSRPAIAGTTRWPRASLRRSRQKRLPSLTPAGNKPASPSLLTSTASTIQPGYTRRWATTRLTTTPGSSGLPPETASWRPFSGARSHAPADPPSRPRTISCAPRKIKRKIKSKSRFFRHSCRPRSTPTKAERRSDRSRQSVGGGAVRVGRTVGAMDGAIEPHG